MSRTRKTLSIVLVVILVVLVAVPAGVQYIPMYWQKDRLKNSPATSTLTLTPGDAGQ